MLLNKIYSVSFFIIGGCVLLARSVFFLLHTFSAGKTETIMRGTPCSQRERWRTSLRQDYCYSKMLQLTGRKCPKGTPLSRCRPESTLFFFFFFFFPRTHKIQTPLPYVLPFSVSPSSFPRFYSFCRSELK